MRAVRYYERELSEISMAVGGRIPKTLNLEEQSYFALGYYQKWAYLPRYGGKKEESAEKSENTEE